jgi:hypothetical protein
VKNKFMRNVPLQVHMSKLSYERQAPFFLWASQYIHHRVSSYAKFVHCVKANKEWYIYTNDVHIKLCVLLLARKNNFDRPKRFLFVHTETIYVSVWFGLELHSFVYAVCHRLFKSYDTSLCTCIKTCTVPCCRFIRSKLIGLRNEINGNRLSKYSEYFWLLLDISSQSLIMEVSFDFRSVF